MKLSVPSHDHRLAHSPEADDVVDETTGKIVGVIKYWGDQQRLISLFDDKYTGVFLTNAECAAFAKGR